MRHAWLPGDRWSSNWDEVREFLDGMGPDFAHEVEIIDSIKASGVGDQLVFKTSHCDLWVARVPIRPGPTEFIHVQAPNSIRNPPPGQVVIEHRSYRGKDDRIERPISETVALFWRFCAEKFGILANQPGAAN
ncbi:MAG TPA: hypothetical protein VF479_04870 [Pseudolysinimonas sp.]